VALQAASVLSLKRYCHLSETQRPAQAKGYQKDRMGNQVDFQKTYQYIPFPPWLPVNTHIKEKNEM